MNNQEEYQKLFKIVQSFSYAIGVILSASLLRRIINASEVDLEYGFDFFKIITKR